MVISETQGVDDRAVSASEKIKFWVQGELGGKAPSPRLLVSFVVEIAILIFFFYSVRLMGEFTASSGRGKTMSVAIENILTGPNLLIAGIAALVGCLVIEYLRNNQ